MLRLPHGATSRPQSRRPENGYGRLPGRPGPDPVLDELFRAGRAPVDPTVLLETAVIELDTLAEVDAALPTGPSEWTRRPDHSI